MDIKGIKEGILIKLDEQSWQDAKNLILEKITNRQDFFRGARVVLDVGNIVLEKEEVIDVQENLRKKDLQLVGILSKSLVTQKVVRSFGLIPKLEKPARNSAQQLKPIDTILEGDAAIFINKTLRSGYKVAYQGHIVVLGDVNPGAEIIASGSVIVWGSLRGTVHAGLEGDQSACVCALDLSPMQLRIASHFAVTPQDQADHQPEMAIIDKGQIIAIPWDHKKRR